jgi:hypothetical protein
VSYEELLLLVSFTLILHHAGSNRGPELRLLEADAPSPQNRAKWALGEFESAPEYEPPVMDGSTANPELRRLNQVPPPACPARPTYGTFVFRFGRYTSQPKKTRFGGVRSSVLDMCL